MRKKKSGSTAKAEAVTVRIDPRSRITLELLSRSMKKPLSATFEWCLDVGARLLDEKTPYDRKESIFNIVRMLDLSSELDLILTLGEWAPSLFTFEEKSMFEAIRRSPELRVTVYRDASGAESPGLEFDESLNAAVGLFADRDLIQKHMEEFRRLALDSAASTPPFLIRREDLERQKAKTDG